MSTPFSRPGPVSPADPAPVAQAADDIPAVSHAEMDAAFEHGWVCVVEGLVDPDLDAITARLLAAEEIADAAREPEE